MQDLLWKIRTQSVVVYSIVLLLILNNVLKEIADIFKRNFIKLQFHFKNKMFYIIIHIFSSKTPKAE